MKNIGRTLLSPVCALAMVANSLSVAMAQDRSADGKTGAAQTVAEIAATINTRIQEALYTRVQESVNRGLAYAGQQGGDSVFQFFSQEMSFDSRLVKGAPFSADIDSETIQILPDGNRIVQRSEGRIYRDSQGRTRSERTYQMGGSSEQKHVINIRDSVAGSNYSLDPETRIARKSGYIFVPLSMGSPSDLFLTPPFNPDAPSNLPRGVIVNVPTISAPVSPAAPDAPGQSKKISGAMLQWRAIKRVQPVYPATARAMKVSGAVQVQITISETGEVIEASAVSGHPLLREPALQAARQWQFEPTEVGGAPVKTQGSLTFHFMSDNADPAQSTGARKVPNYPTNTEQLGKRKIEGVECEGTRAVTSMPAGAIGNERPIETVYETWYSPELRMTILSRRSDPRFGESTYQVTNIVRSEPDAALFQIPSDYTIIDSRANKVELDLRVFEEMRRKLEEAQKKTEGAQKPNNQ
jgi:TonB family protein